MKKRFLIIAALIVLLTTCPEPGGNPTNVIDPNQKTTIVFDNTQGICAVTVYSSYTRSEESKIARIPAGILSQEFEQYPGSSVPFFLSYQINFKGISGFTVDFVPPENAKNQIYVRIDSNIKTTITIPTLAETLSSPEALLSSKSYLLIQNNSSYSIQLLRGNSILPPDNMSETVVNSRERAQYTINPGAASNYQLLVGGDNITLSDSIDSFEAGCAYNIVFDGGVYLLSKIYLKLENVAVITISKPFPEAPVVKAGDRLLTVSWTAVEGADSYEVYIGTAQNPPAIPEKTVSSTTTVLDGLVNKTVYYVWIKALNSFGPSDFSLRTRGIPWSVYEVPATPVRPVIIPGINQLTVNWEDCGGASSYEVYINTTTTTPSSATVTSDKTSAVINNLQNDVIYYVWVRAVNNAGKSGYSPVEAGTPRIPTVAPATPSRPVLTAGSRELSVSWQAVELASAYEVWFGISDDSSQAQKFGGDISGGVTETVITGLTNEATYYVWIKAKNVVGTSGFSFSANARTSAFVAIPETPAAPSVISGNRELSVSWQAIEGALFYEVWSGSTNNPANATKHGADVSGTSVTLTSLDNWTTYYVWIKAKNNVGTSGFSPVASGAPLGTNNERSPGLYRNNAKIGNQNLSAALSYISTNAVSGDDFYIVLGAYESASPINLDYSGKIVGITLLGYGGERTISLSSNGSLFTINTGVTLTLDENITLLGRSTNNSSLVFVNLGNLVMNTGAKISGNNAGNSNGGGINVSGGTFTMHGGLISGNTTSNNAYGGGGGGIYVSYVSGGTFTMHGGSISGNTTSFSGGGGINVSSGTFTMHGGSISGNTGDGIYAYGSGTYTMHDGTISNNNGSGIYVYRGAFTMHGGIISGNNTGVLVDGDFKKLPSDSWQNSGIIYGSEETGIDVNGVPLRNTNAVVTVTSMYSRFTTAGQTDQIDTTWGRGLSANGEPPYKE